MPEHCDRVSVSRTIGAPASKLFETLARTANHPLLDGSGMVRATRSDIVVSSIGDVFNMEMYNDEMGHYEMANYVVEYEPDRRIAWEPELFAASRAEDVAEIGDRGRHRWGFELEHSSPDTTVVTETYDCSASPDWLRKAVRGGERWRDSMTATLEKLDAMATTSGSVGTD